MPTIPVIDRIKTLIRSTLAQEVPEEDAFCEFECRESSCCGSPNWEGCPKRTEHTEKNH